MYSGNDILYALQNGTKDVVLNKYISHIKYKELKRRVDFEELKTLEDVNKHWYLGKVLPAFINHATKNDINDLYITGSWVRGTYRHPYKEVTHDKIKLSEELGKINISDLDFWTETTSKEKFNEVFKNFSKEHVSWVSWPGPGILITTDLDPKSIVQRGCNKENRISNNYKRAF